MIYVNHSYLCDLTLLHLLVVVLWYFGGFGNIVMGSNAFMYDLFKIMDMDVVKALELTLVNNY